MAEEWRIPLRWSVITAFLGVLIVLGQAAGALQALEPWTIASRGWVRDWAVPIIRERNEKIAVVQVELNEKLDNLVVQQYTLQLLVLDSLATSLRSELIDLQLRLREAPTDRLLLQRKETIEALIRDNNANLKAARCALQPQSSLC